MLYNISEIFFSKQGEGYNVGQSAIFVRFGGCNLKCELRKTPLSPGGFNCDTDFVSSNKNTFSDVIKEIIKLSKNNPDWIIFTGGEPMLQLDLRLVEECNKITKTAIETNGTINCDKLPLNWVCVSPKVAEHCIKQLKADEVKYVRSHGQPLPKTSVKANHFYISPAFEGWTLSEQNLKWCQNLVKGTKWQISVQQHKLVNLR